MRVILLCMPSFAYPVMLVRLWLSCSGSPFLAVLSRLPYPDILPSGPVPAVQLWLYCTSNIFLTVLCLQSGSVYPDLLALVWLSRSDCLVWLVIKLSCSRCPFLAVISLCPALASLSKQSCAGSAVLAAMLEVLSWQPVHAVLSCQLRPGSPACPILPVQFCLSCSAYFFCLSSSGCPMLALLI
jgi:hypothetical protein